MTTIPNKTTDVDYRNSPVAWFTVLERARTEHDYERAALAIGELRRLGVTVKYGRESALRKGVAR